MKRRFSTTKTPFYFCETVIYFDETPFYFKGRKNCHVCKAIWRFDKHFCQFGTFWNASCFVFM